jgi:hypothetical protein
MKAITVDEVFGAVAGSLGDLEGLN